MARLNDTIINGSLAVNGDMIVNGTTTTIDAENLTIKDNMIITNSDGASLSGKLSGLAIQTNAAGKAYGIAYDGSSVKLGLGKVTNGNFTFNSGAGQSIATRADSIANKSVTYWNSTANKLEDSGIDYSQIIPKRKSVTIAAANITGSASSYTVTVTDQDILSSSFVDIYNTYAFEDILVSNEPTVTKGSFTFEINSKPESITVKYMIHQRVD